MFVERIYFYLQNILIILEIVLHTVYAFFSNFVDYNYPWPFPGIYHSVQTEQRGKFNWESSNWTEWYERIYDERRIIIYIF